MRRRDTPQHRLFKCKDIVQVAKHVMLHHICEVCGTEQNLTSDAAFEAGWDGTCRKPCRSWPAAVMFLVSERGLIKSGTRKTPTSRSDSFDTGNLLSHRAARSHRRRGAANLSRIFHLSVMASARVTESLIASSTHPREARLPSAAWVTITPMTK